MSTDGSAHLRADHAVDTLLEVTDLRVHFPVGGGLLRRPTGAVRAVDGVSFRLARGQTLGLVGESGSGKSTAGRAILRLIRPTFGSVRFDGVELTGLSAEAMRRMRRRMQVIFQDPYASLNPRMKVHAAIREPIGVHGLRARTERDDRVRELLDIVGLDPSMGDRYPHEFSGGQRQRIGIARALAVQPEFVVADEPISALDVSVRAQIVNLLRDLQERLGLTYLFIAHDLAVVRTVAHRVAVMYLGRIVEIGPRDDLYTRPLHPYTHALLSAVPIPDPEVEARRRRIVLVGEIPSPDNPPSGCRFRTRCWLRTRLGDPDICATHEPPLAETRPEHWVACHFPVLEAEAAPGRSTA
jgi:oligopeptide/dipeptide ABC transporter ATP-binding protein